jgi:hypothetical protein
MIIEDIELDTITLTGRYYIENQVEPEEFVMRSDALSDETLNMIFRDLGRRNIKLERVEK